MNQRASVPSDVINFIALRLKMVVETSLTMHEPEVYDRRQRLKIATFHNVSRYVTIIIIIMERDLIAVHAVVGSAKVDRVPVRSSNDRFRRKGREIDLTGITAPCNSLSATGE